MCWQIARCWQRVSSLELWSSPSKKGDFCMRFSLIFHSFPWAAAISAAAAQWSKPESSTRERGAWGMCFRRAPLQIVPTSMFPIAVAEIADDSQEPHCFVSSNQTHSDQEWCLAQAKPKSSWGQGGGELNSPWRTRALFQLTQQVSLTTLWFLPALLLCLSLFPLSKHQGHAKGEGAGFSPMENLSPWLVWG